MMKKLENYHGIEARLTEKLQVYQPNPQFVGRLRTRLVDQSGIEVEIPKNQIQSAACNSRCFKFGCISPLADFLYYLVLPM